MDKKKFKSVAIPPCSWHSSPEIGYIQFFEDASKRDAKGERQKKCHVCGYWFWPDHFGEDPISKIITQNNDTRPQTYRWIFNGANNNPLSEGVAQGD